MQKIKIKYLKLVFRNVYLEWDLKAESQHNPSPRMWWSGAWESSQVKHWGQIQGMRHSGPFCFYHSNSITKEQVIPKGNCNTKGQYQFLQTHGQVEAGNKHFYPLSHTHTKGRPSDMGIYGSFSRLGYCAWPPCSKVFLGKRKK